MAHGQVALESEDDMKEDRAAEAHVVEGVEEVDEHRIVLDGRDLEGLDDGELRDGGHQVQRVESGHDGQDLVEDGQH